MWRWTLIQWLDLKTCKFKLIVVELTQTGCLRLRWKEILKPKGQQHTKTDKALQRFIKTIDMKGFEMTNWNKIQKGGKEYLSAKGERMEQRTRPCMLPYKLRGSVVILPETRTNSYTHLGSKAHSHHCELLPRGSTQLLLYTLSTLAGSGRATRNSEEPVLTGQNLLQVSWTKFRAL